MDWTLWLNRLILRIKLYPMSLHLSRDTWFPTMWYFDMCRLRRAWAASFEALTVQMMFGQHRIFKRPAKALIRLRVRAGWSEPSLIAYTTLLEISCCGSFSFMPRIPNPVLFFSFHFGMGKAYTHIVFLLQMYK